MFSLKSTKRTERIVVVLTVLVETFKLLHQTVFKAILLTEDQINRQAISTLPKLSKVNLCILLMIGILVFFFQQRFDKFSTAHVLKTHL